MELVGYRQLVAVIYKDERGLRLYFVGDVNALTIFVECWVKLVGMMADPFVFHVHEPNLEPPAEDDFFDFVRPDGTKIGMNWSVLLTLPRLMMDSCYIVSTGHGRSGPFAFAGTPLYLFIHHLLPNPTNWSWVAIKSADGFGTSLRRVELQAVATSRPVLLSDQINGQQMSRAEGRVRLIVPYETDDALKQVKWVKEIRVSSG